MTIESLQSQLDAFDQAALYEPGNFRGRADAIDAIALEIIDRVDELLAYPSQPRKLRSLRRAAERLQQRLQAADEEVFHELRSAIRGGCRAEPLSLYDRVSYNTVLSPVDKIDSDCDSGICYRK